MILALILCKNLRNAGRFCVGDSFLPNNFRQVALFADLKYFVPLQFKAGIDLFDMIEHRFSQVISRLLEKSANLAIAPLPCFPDIPLTYAVEIDQAKHDQCFCVTLCESFP